MRRRAHRGARGTRSILFVLVVAALVCAVAPLAMAARVQGSAAGASAADNGRDEWAKSKPTGIRVAVPSLGIVPAVAHSTTGPRPPKNVVFDGESLEAPVSGSEAGGGLPGEVVIPGVPGYFWRDGCGPTAVGMVVGYYDGAGYDDLISGSAATQSDGVNQAIASHGTVEAPRHYEDYAEPIETGDTVLPDKSSTPVGDEHASDCVADFMHTSWASDRAFYGWSWSNMIHRSFLDYVAYRYPGSAPKSSLYSGANLTWDIVKAEIDGSRPMVFLVDSDGDGMTDHFVTVVGYREIQGYAEYACFDTWDVYTIRWEQFRAMSASYGWGVWGGWTFAMDGGPTPTPTPTPTPPADVTPPVTLVEGADTDWHNSAVTVTFSATDDDSGVAYTEYAVDGGSWTRGTTVTLSLKRRGGNTGIHTVAYRSADNAGNVETAKTCEVRLDGVTPRTSDDSDGRLRTGRVTVKLTASDAHSGVLATYASLDGGDWVAGTEVLVTGSGTHAVQYYSVDRAGNVEAVRGCSVRIK